MVMAMWQMIVGAVAQQPTAVPGIDTSFWTAHLRDPEPHDGGGSPPATWKRR
jgi:hypothetical protein